MSQEASDEFMELVMRGGSLAQDCEHCGRTNFANGEQGDWEEGELEELRENAKRQPDKYIEHSYDSISCGDLNGRLLVWGCPCNSGAKYEQFIWDHRELIMRYLSLRTTSILKAAQSDASLAQVVANGVSALAASEAEVARLTALCRLNGIFVELPMPSTP